MSKLCQVLLDFVRSSVMVPESWRHYCVLKSQQHFGSGNPLSKKVNAFLTVGKITAAIFWNSKRILRIEYRKEPNY